jgi:hypothetical protein
MMHSLTRGPSLTVGNHGPAALFRYRLPLSQLDTHVYMVGRTKQGKSKLLEQLLLEIIRLDQGGGLLDPHGDLAEELLARLASQPQWPQVRERIVYVDPSRDDYLIPFNVLHTPGESYAIAQRVLETFRRTWPESLREAPRFANTLLAACLVLIEHDLSLVELPRLLTDAAYRQTLLQGVENSEAKAFFEGRYNQWGREQPLMAESVLNKVSALVLNPRLRLLLGQSENSLDLRQIMDEKRILIVNLGRVDAETRHLLGNLLMTGLEQAAFSRQDIALTQRAPFFFALDEFQDYAAHEGGEQTLGHILAECRKFGLHLLLAHQHLGQLGDRLHSTLENAGVKIAFGAGRETAEALSRELFVPQVGATDMAPQEQPTRRQTPHFVSLAEQREEFTQRILHLPRREFLLQIAGEQKVRRLRTVTLPDLQPSPADQEALQSDLARRSGRPVAQMQARLKVHLPRSQVNQPSYYEPADADDEAGDDQTPHPKWEMARRSGPFHRSPKAGVWGA